MSAFLVMPFMLSLREVPFLRAGGDVQTVTHYVHFAGRYVAFFVRSELFISHSEEDSRSQQLRREFS